MRTENGEPTIGLQHFMWLSKKEGFENEEELHFSDTFQRAMLNDCLLDICQKYALNTSDFFKNENQYFLDRTNKDEIGAWSYFPTVQEVAADIDDLGQVMQQFILTKNKNLVDEYCKKAIYIALNERTTENGGIETWILPKSPITEIQKKQDFFNATKWGKGPDVEVVANFCTLFFCMMPKNMLKPSKKEFLMLFPNKKRKDFGKADGIMAIITELMFVFVC